MVVLYHLTCLHYEVYVSRPQPKRSSMQTPGQPSKRACQEDQSPPTSTSQTTKLDSPSPSDSSRANDDTVKFLSPTIVSSSCSPQRVDSATDPEGLPASSGGPDTSGSLRPVRTRRLPARFRDVIPEAPPPAHIEPPPPPLLPRIILHVFDTFRTAFNPFGIAREYRHRPSCDPDSFLSLEELSNKCSHTSIVELPKDFACPPLPPWPWGSMTIWRLMNWMFSSGQQKSAAEVTRLASTVLTAEDFCPDDLVGFNAYTELRRFDASENELNPNSPFHHDGWTQSSITISVPTREWNPAGNGADFPVTGFFHRNLTAVVRAAFSDSGSKWFHFTPFRRIWRSPTTGKEQRIYDELYTSDSWIKAQDELQKHRRPDGCTLERVIAGLMFSSDSTHLTQFGHASAWPIYMSFGNLSKYIRARPSTHLQFT